MSLARSVGRNAIWNAAGRFGVLLVWFAATPHVLAALGPDRFGYWSILLALGVTLASVDLGLGIAVTRDVAALASRGDLAGVRRLAGGAVLVQATIGLVFVVAGLLAREPLLAAFHVPAAWMAEARQAFVLALGGYGLLATGNVLLATLQGLQRMDRAAQVTLPLAAVLYVGIILATRTAEPLVVLTLVQVGHGLLIFVALAVALHLLLRADAAGGTSIAPGERASLRRLLALGGWVQLSALLGLVHGQVDKFYLGTRIALAPVASYELGARIGQAAVMLPILFLGALLPAAARFESSVGREARLPLYRAALPPHYLLSFGLIGALVGLAPALLEAWLGTPPPGATWMLRGLAVSYGLSLAGGVASTLVRSAGAMRIEIIYVVVLAVLHVVLSWFGLLVAGAPGVVLGNVVGSLIAVVWFIRQVESWLGADPLRESLRAAAPALVAATAAGGAAALSLEAVAKFGGLAPGQARGAATLAAGGVTYGLVFVAVLATAFRPAWVGLRARVRSILQPGPGGAP